MSYQIFSNLLSLDVILSKIDFSTISAWTLDPLIPDISQCFSIFFMTFNKMLSSYKSIKSMLRIFWNFSRNSVKSVKYLFRLSNFFSLSNFVIFSSVILIFLFLLNIFFIGIQGQCCPTEGSSTTPGILLGCCPLTK